MIDSIYPIQVEVWGSRLQCSISHKRPRWLACWVVGWPTDWVTDWLYGLTDWLTDLLFYPGTWSSCLMDLLRLWLVEAVETHSHSGHSVWLGLGPIIFPFWAKHLSIELTQYPYFLTELRTDSKVNAASGIISSKSFTLVDNQLGTSWYTTMPWGPLSQPSIIQYC